MFLPYNLLFAFKSKVSKKTIITKIQDDPQLSMGMIPAVCVADKALWKVGKISNNKVWQVFVPVSQDEEEQMVDRLVWFAGIISNMSFMLHCQRVGIDHAHCLSSGIGFYLPDNVWKAI